MPTARNRLFACALAILVLGAMEAVGRVAIRVAGPPTEALRLLLMGDEQARIVHAQNSVSQAYLLYIPAPNFEALGVLQNNAHGYRGPLVPLERTAGRLRILFMGGSTTYGWTVARPEQAYPAQVGALLEQMRGRGELPAEVAGVEVINAGLMHGTSAEIATHFLFKYRYYEPDILVINSGGNDAQGSAMVPGYLPDYSHWRRSLPGVRPLPRRARWILRSRLVAFVSIRLFYGHLTRGAYFALPSPAPVAAPWYELEPGAKQVPDEYLAFRHNLQAVVRAATAEGIDVVLVPFRPSPRNTYAPGVRAEMQRNERVLREIAAQPGASLAPFPADVIDPGSWVDDCHLDARGERQKAAHVAEHIARRLRSE